MDARIVLVFVVFGVNAVVTGVAGACYQFIGSGQVSFRDNIEIKPSAHFKLTFKTIADVGVLYYARGNYHRERVFDFEGIYIRDGFLHYLLYNPGEYSIGPALGFRGRSNKKVDDGFWHTVEFYRNIQVETVKPDLSTETVYQTGLKLDGEMQEYDNNWRTGVSIFQPVVLGSDPFNTLANFKGKIKDFQEVRVNHQFEEGDAEGGVSRCIAETDVV